MAAHVASGNEKKIIVINIQWRNLSYYMRQLSVVLQDTE
jgi:hypothetical protein